MSPEPTTPGAGTTELALGELLKQVERTRAAIAEAEPASDAETIYVADAEQAISNMEMELTVARAALTAERANSEPDLETALGEVAEAARRWLDDADVQAHLGRMELQDRVSTITQYLDRARGEVVRAAERVSEAVGTEVSAVRSATLSSIEGMRDAIVDAGRSIRAAGRTPQE